MHYESYLPLIDQAIAACMERKFFAHFPDHPKAYGEEAPLQATEQFKLLQNQPFGLLQPGTSDQSGEEISPYTGQRLGISYPLFDANSLVTRAQTVAGSWAALPVKERAALLVASLDRIRDSFFLIAHATMHTTGQSFIMSFQASGPHAADRALEAIAMGVHQLTLFPEQVSWEKPMGKTSVRLEKTFRPIPKGIGLVIGCSTFPVWNTLPGLYASLVTGNPVIVKPHPGAVLPIALVVRAIQDTLKENGLDPEICQLAADRSSHPLTKSLCGHPAIRLIDYTGGTEFGNYVESLPGKNVFTEKAGINSVILDSVVDPSAVMQNLAFSVSLYSGQMCTAPQNIFISEKGIGIPGGRLGFDQVATQFSDAVKALVTNPKMGPGTLAAIQNEATKKRAEQAQVLGRKLLEELKPENPDFPTARMASPVILELDAADRQVYEKEWFGPVVLLIKTRDLDHSLELARDMALNHGAIICSAYTTDPQIMDRITELMNNAFTPVSFNFTGPIWVNQHSAFSDFHLTGGNPAGTGSLTDPEFIDKRFVWVGNRMMPISKG